MPTVAPISGPQLPPPVTVVWNTPSVVVSAAMALYTILTPLYAYIFEHWPWTVGPSPVARTTWAAEKPAWLAFNRDRYSPAYFAGASMARDASSNTDVYRRTFNLTRPITGCRDNFFYQLDNGATLGAELQAIVCDVVTNTSAPAIMGGCQQGLLFALRASVQCLWFAPAPDGGLDYFHSYHQAPAPQYLYGMLVYRLALALYLGWRVRRRYLQPVRALHRHCEQLSAAKCEVVLGDPTGLVLLDTLVPAAMVLDLWLSVPVIGAAALAASQVRAFGQCLRGITYLSRTVWFAYGSLALLSTALKKWHAEARFKPADATVLAALATVVAGPMTYLQARSSLLVQLYEQVFSAADADAIQVFRGVLLFHVFIAALPAVYYVRPATAQVSPTAVLAKAVTTRYTTVGATDWKQRLLLPLFLRHVLREPGVKHHGCSIYNFFYVNAAFRACPTLSQRGSDCYLVLFDASGKPTEVSRLALCSRVDLAPAGVPVTTERRDDVFGSLSIIINKGATGPTFVVIVPTQARCNWLE
ncbi:hypothetical protein ACHHYP_16062 [Achlya hypogyna]|uniref:Transmembrane protein n=1 Tax=Achlya hypogyna TaxID=1202772 RepID=A0A1V9Y9S2_ACHHY|nr:hypothetical protein ACHHYP_16062 [Achlya hypogyna]